MEIDFNFRITADQELGITAEVTPAAVHEYAKSWSYGTQGVNTGALLQALRTNAPGAWSDNRLAQSQRYIDVVYVAISARCNAMASCTVEITDMSNPEPDFGGPQLKSWNRRDPMPPIGAEDFLANYEFDDLELEYQVKSALSHQPHIQPKGNPVEYDHELYKLIENPNHEDTMADFLYEFLMQLDLTGSTLVWKVPNHLGACREMYVIPTALAQPMPYSARFPRGAWRITPLYAYGPYAVLPSGVGTSGAVVPAEQIVKCKRKHPFLRWDGYSKLTGMSVGIDLLKQIDLARWNAMLDGIYPSGVFKIDVTKGGPKLNQAALDAFESKLIQKFSSARNFGRFMIPPPGVEFDPTSTPPVSMAFESGWEQIANFVMSGLGIPATVISGTAAGNYAELYARMKQYYLLDLMPDVRKISAWYTKHIATDWSDTLRVNLHLPTLDDPQLFENQLAQDDQIGIRTKDERRKIRGLEPWGGEIGRQIVGGPENLADAKAQAQLAKADKDESVASGEEEPDTEADTLAEANRDHNPKRTIVTSQTNGDGKQDVNKYRTKIPEHRQGKGSLPSKVNPIRKSWSENGHSSTLREELLNALNGQEKPHKFSTTHFELPPEVCVMASKMALAIPDYELAEDGREDEFHITAKYGLHTNDPGVVESAVDGFGPVTVRLGLVSTFPATDEHPYDVVKVDVDSGQLRALNRLISKSIPCTDTHPEYCPHITIGYVAPGEGQKYIGDDSLLGLKITFSTLVFSDQEGNTYPIELGPDEHYSRVPMLAGSSAIGQPQGMKGHWFTSKQGFPYYSEHGGGGDDKGDQPPPTKESWKKDHPKLAKEVAEKEGDKEDEEKGKKDKEADKESAVPSDKLEGGLADKIPESEFSPEKVAEGAKVEKEHTDDPEVAKEIARDHLSEDKDYYEKLKEVEKPEEAKPEEKPAETAKEEKPAEAATEEKTAEAAPEETPKEEEKPKELSESDKKLQSEAISRFGKYFKPKQRERLEAIARKSISARMQSRVDPEEAVSDALMGYYRDLESGKFIPSDEKHERASIARMVELKVRNAIEAAKAKKRDVGREAQQAGEEETSPVETVGDKMTPEETEVRTEEFVRDMMKHIDSPRDKDILESFASGMDKNEIAQKIGRDVKVVNRAVENFAKIIGDEYPEYADTAKKFFENRRGAKKESETPEQP